MSTPIVGSASSTSGTGGNGTTRTAGTLDNGQDTFLKLLTEQLKIQIGTALGITMTPPDTSGSDSTSKTSTGGGTGSTGSSGTGTNSSTTNGGK